MSTPTFGPMEKFAETIARNIRTAPRIAQDAYIADDATVVANVEIGPEASVWHQAVLRGDVAPIVLGARSNVQDGAVVHTADDLPAIIGQLVTVGHKVIVHACTVEDEVLVGMGSIILDGAHIGTRSIIGANATVKQDMEVPRVRLSSAPPGRSCGRSPRPSRTRSKCGRCVTCACRGSISRCADRRLQPQLRSGGFFVIALALEVRGYMSRRMDVFLE